MKKKILIIALSLVALIIVGIVSYICFILYKIDKKPLPQNNSDLGISEDMQQQLQQHKYVPPQLQKDPEVVNIAFFGLDTANPDALSRSDVIMIVSLDSKNEKVKVTSLMRDMYVMIPGKYETRINAAYAFGGPQLALKTINTDFGLDIKDYVKIEFTGMEKLVDKLGGIKIDVRADEAPECYVSRPGLQTLNGKQALAYSRIRHVGHADYERTERQRRVLNIIFKKIKSQGLFKIPETIMAVLPYVETSLSSAKILNLALAALKFRTENIEQYRIPVDGHYRSQKIRGMDVLVPDMEENKKLLHAFIYN